MATEHRVAAVFRRVAPYALRQLDAELARAEAKVETASNHLNRLPYSSSPRKVASAVRRLDKARTERDKLLRLRAEIREAQRG